MAVGNTSPDTISGGQDKEQPMNLLALNASHRGQRGITARLVAFLSEGGQQAGAGVETLSLARLKINRCLSCHQC